MFGFMLISWFLSMWIANTAAAAMMIPIVLAVLDELERSDDNDTNSGIGKVSREISSIYEVSTKSETLVKKTPRTKKKKHLLMISSLRLVKI